MYVLGTAGHVDHGKSTLVKALTGIDPDRLKEEKDRQMTIDLGFAWYKLPSGNEVGIVDVPGHRDFIDNMLAGVGGIDAVLLVIAADEGVMPQTREHLAILKLLKIQHGLIVLTKIDLVEDNEWLEMVEADIHNLVQGSFLKDAPIIRVSAFTQAGLDQLSASIEEVLRNCPPKRNNGRPRLPVDRVFSLKGFGTIVTGTLVDGEFHAGQVVEVLPTKKETRIRSIQSHKKKVEIALPGNRTAINLVGLDTNEIKRGNVVVSPGDYIASRRIDAKIEMMADASGKIGHNDYLKCFIGTTQSIVRVRVLGKKEIQPGEDGWVQLEFEDPIVADKGDYFVLRRPSPAETIAGGEILNAHPLTRYKRFSDEVISKMKLMESGSDQEVLLSNLENHCPISYQDFLRVSGLDADKTHELIESLKNREVFVIGAAGVKDSLIVSRTYWLILQDDITRIFNSYYQQYPLRESMPRKDLQEKLKLPLKQFSLVIQQLLADNFLLAKNDQVGLLGYEIEFTEKEKDVIQTILDDYRVHPFMPPSVNEMKERYGSDMVAAMIEKGYLLEVGEDIAILPEVYSQIVKETVAYLTKESQITLGQFRDMFQTSRKYALAFLEYLDQQKITVREEDHRRLSSDARLSSG